MASGGHFQKNTANGTVYTKDLRDGAENGVIQRIFNALQQEKIIAIKVEVLALDSTSCKLHPDAHGALKNTDSCPSENQKGGWNTKLHVVSANDKVIVEMHLSGGNCHDAPQGRISIEHIGDSYSGVPILMDRAYEGRQNQRTLPIIWI